LSTRDTGFSRVARDPATALSHLSGHVTSLAPGSVLGVGVYVGSREVWAALLACVLGPPAVAVGQVAAEWVRLLRPSRVLRRPRRRGS
jgi:phosphoribosylcarboxyaminoimidazole (NCAIR) mutase